MSAVHEGTRSALLRDAGAIAGDIKIAHSVFALPFALLGALLAAAPVVDGRSAPIEWRRFGLQLLLIVLAMVAARTAAMLANRILDAAIDAENPRTAGRAIPAGRLSRGRAVVALAGAAAIFLMICAGFGAAFDNWWPLRLGVPVLAWICAYGWFKRFTSLCHLYLGSSLAMAPLCAAIAIDPAQAIPFAQPTLWLLSLMVLCWVAGFDVIYALQDVECDRRQGLFSLPSRLGVRPALWISRGLHVIAAVALWAATLGDPRFGPAMQIAAALTTVLLSVEHATVERWGTTRMALTFFTLNGVISCIVGALGALDVLTR